MYAPPRLRGVVDYNSKKKMDDVAPTDGDYDGQEEELQWTDGDYCLLQPLSDEEDVMKMEDKYVK